MPSRSRWEGQRGKSIRGFLVQSVVLMGSCGRVVFVGFGGVMGGVWRSISGNA